MVIVGRLIIPVALLLRGGDIPAVRKVQVQTVTVALSLRRDRELSAVSRRTTNLAVKQVLKVARHPKARVGSILKVRKIKDPARLKKALLQEAGPMICAQAASS